MKYFFALAFSLLTGASVSAQSIDPPTPEQLAKEKSKATKGDTAAMHHMALYYYYGKGVPKDNLKAIDWLTKAGQKGHTAAMIRLSAMYEDGRGVPKDLVKAFTWMKKAAEKGDARAMSDVASMYEEGIGTPANAGEAAKWYGKAAETGNTEAMMGLAMCYIDGSGVRQDKEEGLKWMQRAADKGDFMALRFMGDFYADSAMGNNCAKALECYMKSGDNGDTASIVAIGEICIDGDCPGGDFSSAARWMRTQADKGNNVACYFMARFHIDGKGVDQDYGKAMDYFIKDADIQIKNGAKKCNSIKNLFVLYDMNKLSTTRKEKLLDWFDATARTTQDDETMAGLGYIYTNKEPASKRDYQTAMDWSVRAADKGNATGCYNVGYLYANGLGVQQNDTEAYSWMLKAAKKGDKAAMTALADFYEEGVGVAKNHTKALEWKAKAKQAGGDEE